MRCKHCDAKLAAHDIWCVNCGRQTQIVNKDLSACSSLKRTWEKYKSVKGGNVPAAATVLILGLLPVAVLLIALHSFGYLDLVNLKTAGALIVHLLAIGLGVCVFIPVFMIPFKPVCADPAYSLKWKDVLTAFRSYPRYLALAAACVVYYILIYLICFGLPNFGSDPILRLVWIVLLNYFAAIALPVPVLMERLNVNALKALKISYKNMHAVRWQIFLLALILAVLNALALLILIVPLLVTVPFTWYAIRDYTDRLLEFELLRPEK